VTDDDRPRVDVHDPLGTGLGPVNDPHRAVIRAGLHERGRRGRVGSGGGAVGGGCRGPADGIDLRRDRLRECPDDLAQRAADRVGGIADVVVAVEHSHDQSEGLGRGEHQRREPDAAAEAKAAVGTTDGFDRDAGFTKDPDVPPSRPFRDTELAGEPVCGDAGAVLDQFQGQQRPCGGARVELHRNRPANPEAERPEWKLACCP